MRGPLQSWSHCRFRPWPGLAVVFMTAAAVALARAGTEPEPATDAITLAADRLQYWDEGPLRWVLLDGRAAVLQGDDGLRAGVLLARIDTSKDPGPSVYHVEAYAEGLSRAAGEDSATSRPRRLVLRTQGEVRLQSHEPDGVVRLEQAPKDLALINRGFPKKTKPVVSEDTDVQRTQFEDEQIAPGLGIDSPPAPSSVAGVGVPDAGPMPNGSALDFSGPINLEDLAPPPELPGTPGVAEPDDRGPILPDTVRYFTFNPRDSGSNFKADVRTLPDGRITIILRGGVNITAEQPGQGTIDISADNAVVWTQRGPQAAASAGERVAQDSRTPLEVYLEGNVIFRQDRRQIAGTGDQKIVQAERFYIDLRTEWFLAERAEVDIFNPFLITPLKIHAATVRQYRPPLGLVDGKMAYGPAQIHADQSLLTGSRFPVPGYRFQSRSVDLAQIYTPLIGPDGKPVANPKEPGSDQSSTWRIDARGNVFRIGRIPVFYWPRILTDTDDLDPPLRQIQFRANNYFGQQLLTDWSVFKILGLKQPTFIDNWNFDLDYLSYRGVALGTELGWSGRDLIGDLTDPYHKLKTGRDVSHPYFGYFDIWGLNDHRFFDTLGPGPAVITNGPPGAGQAGFQREKYPFFQNQRERVVLRHMQYLTGPDAPLDEETRVQLEADYLSDRNFQEQYYKRVFDMGLNQDTLAYLIRQRENRAFTLLTSANLQEWYTASQFFPKLDYYRLGDAPFRLFSYWGDSGVDYANTHTDVMVNNPHIFAFQPFDPVSATSGAFQTGRAWTSHELSLPLNLGVFRFTPYVQGQLVGWDNQYATALPPLTLSPILPDQAYVRDVQGARLGRIWGAAGAHLNMMAWKVYPTVESELLNVHGLAHKINFDADFRTTYSNVPLNRIGVQDELDDNNYEYTRRYFALISYFGGVLPAQYDPRFLTLRRTISPITGTTDVQASMETLKLAVRQRLQTKRGPEGQRRIVDWMTLDFSSTYFPLADRDNFSKPWGLTQYNYEWFLGDRTSIISTGWFEFWEVTGRPILQSNPTHTNSPFGLDIITTGISFSRPPRGNFFLGYSVINTGVIATSALNSAYSYWLSPKWYGSFSTSYDFGNRRWLGSTWGVTRIGADFLTSIGLTADPLRQSYMFGLEITPRMSPTVRFGSGGGFARFDPRSAPTQ